MYQLEYNLQLVCVLYFIYILSKLLNKLNNDFFIHINLNTRDIILATGEMCIIYTVGS